MKPRNFIIIFDEKEGTSAIVRLLSNFKQMSIVHLADGKGWEPFDKHNCGRMPLKSIKRCFDIIFSKNKIDMLLLNKIYLKTATKPLADIDPSKSIGFKMRFRPTKFGLSYIENLFLIRKVIRLLVINSQNHKYKNTMIKLAKKHNLVIFIAIRQDILRWALSKYHGDGSGNPGHLQFKLAAGLINKEDIPKLHVDCDKLAKIINNCKKISQRKKDLMLNFKQAGIQTYSLKYEDFNQDKFRFFQNIFNKLCINMTKEELISSLEKGTCYKKVHSDDISTFVLNYQEVYEKFGDKLINWNKELVF